jgi:hypothetical protein
MNAAERLQTEHTISSCMSTRTARIRHSVRDTALTQGSVRALSNYSVSTHYLLWSLRSHPTPFHQKPAQPEHLPAARRLLSHRAMPHQMVAGLRTPLSQEGKLRSAIVGGLAVRGRRRPAHRRGPSRRHALPSKCGPLETWPRQAHPSTKQASELVPASGRKRSEHEPTAARTRTRETGRCVKQFCVPLFFLKTH